MLSEFESWHLVPLSSLFSARNGKSSFLELHSKIGGKKNEVDGWMLSYSASPCQRCMTHSSAVLCTNPGFLSLSLHPQLLHHHASCTRDTSMLMHKQTSTQHPREEKMKIVFGDDTVPKQLHWRRQRALRCKYTDSTLCEGSMFPATCARTIWLGLWPLPSPCVFSSSQCAVLLLPILPPHHILFAVFTQICWFRTSAMYLYSLSVLFPWPLLPRCLCFPFLYVQNSAHVPFVLHVPFSPACL